MCLYFLKSYILQYWVYMPVLNINTDKHEDLESLAVSLLSSWITCLGNSCCAFPAHSVCIQQHSWWNRSAASATVQRVDSEALVHSEWDELLSWAGVSRTVWRVLIKWTAGKKLWESALKWTLSFFREFVCWAAHCSFISAESLRTAWTGDFSKLLNMFNLAELSVQCVESL